MVRDAIIECFLNAHRDHLGLTGGYEQAERDYCTKIVEQSFKETKGDFHNPTRESVLAALP
ncbi:hypothetical protein HY971_00210 [Candidatus Kaiserbacteria bacterium]|nr:hypothetical protein [Candidatus Kaiserbacteria bacterium]